MDEDERWMRAALEQAEEALARREVPVGCVFVEGAGTPDARVVAAGGNEVNELGNATRHAELVALDKLHAQLRGETLSQVAERLTLFVTCEPCIMCAAAVSKAGVRTAVYGCANDKFGGCGSVLRSAAALEARGGVLAAEAVALFRRFYERGNPQSKEQLQAQLQQQEQQEQQQLEQQQEQE